MLGNLLRADPTEKARFLEEAHAAWVRGGWAVRGDNTPTAGVVLAALEEATRRLAERYGWQRVEVKARVRVPKEVLSLLRVAPRGVRLDGEGVFVVSSQFSEKAAWKAAYRLVRGETVVLLPKTGEKDVLKVRSLILEKVKTLLQKQEEGERVKLPWGETVRVLPGDRWEDLEAPEPRISAAIRGLREATEVLREEQEEEEEIGVPGNWVHQTRVNPWLVKVYLKGEARGVEAAYLQDEAFLRDLYGEVNIYNPGELAAFLGVELRERGKARGGWVLILEQQARKFPPSYKDVQERFTRKGSKGWVSWAGLPLLEPLVAYEVNALGFKDPEAAYQDGLMEALEIWGRLQRKYAQEVKEGKGFNPLLFLVPELRKFLLELRAQEVGVFRLSRADAQKLRKYFYLRERGLDPIEAGRKARLSPELLSALQAEDVSGDALVELGVDPREEVDYDTFLLRVKVKELKEEIARWWGPKGEAFVEALMEGQTSLGAQLEVGLSNEEAEEIKDFLRSELEGWVE
ncbi:hypothetical protein CSW38_02110 [Thermus scotoductus]|uniref:Uncharacterized protein n=1 Tax=Thermus scotoductus TaxID=37636 RepID=A0A430S2S0_THESC|nr:hypothetical protein CSW38_02110 [Thermus scotoductus]